MLKDLQFNIVSATTGWEDEYFFHQTHDRYKNSWPQFLREGLAWGQPSTHPVVVFENKLITSQYITDYFPKKQDEAEKEEEDEEDGGG